MSFACVKAVMFDVHGVVVTTRDPCKAFDEKDATTIVRPALRTFVKSLLDTSRRVGFVSYGSHDQLDPLLRAGLGDELFSRVVVVTPGDIGLPECQQPCKADVGKFTLCAHASELFGAPAVSLGEMLLIEDSATNATEFLSNAGGCAVLFMGGLAGRCFGQFLDRCPDNADTLAWIHSNSDASVHGYRVADGPW